MALAWPPIFGGGVGAEVLDDDLGLLGQVRWVERHEPGDGPPGLGSLVGGVVGDGLLDPPVGLVGRVVGEHVEDEALLDGLAHGVEVERLESAGLLVPGAEHLQGPGLGGGGEGEEREVGLLAPSADGLGQGLLDRVDGLGDEPGVLGLGDGQLLLVGRAEGQPQVLGGLAGLGGVGLVDDDGVAAVGQLADLVEDEGELLEGGDDDARLLPGQRLGELSWSPCRSSRRRRGRARTGRWSLGAGGRAPPGR